MRNTYPQESRFRLGDRLLTIGQYVIDGVLASSFIQETLTKQWIGRLGLLVLLASLFRQRFHPEVEAENARKKALCLTARLGHLKIK